MRKTLATLTVVFAANTGHAHDEANCRDISNLLARLSCYDESHSGVAHGSTTTRTNVRASSNANPLRQQALRTLLNSGPLTHPLGSRDACSATAIQNPQRRSNKGRKAGAINAEITPGQCANLDTDEGSGYVSIGWRFSENQNRKHRWLPHECQ